MEYARHKRRRRRAAEKRGGEAGRALLSLVMIAAIVYLVCASAAGTWIAQNVMAPVFSALDGLALPLGESAPSAQPGMGETPGETLGEAMQVSLMDTPDAVEADVALPALTCFALQMGVYAQEENARAQAAELQSAGAGGCLWQDGARYRVIAAGFAQQADAQAVKAQLQAQGTDCTVYALSTPSATYRVSALEEQLPQIRSGFAAIANAQTALTEAALRYDAEKQDAAAGKAAAAAVADTLQKDMALLSSYGAAGGLGELLACYEDCLAAIQKAAESSAQDNTRFASDLKYAQLCVTDRYAQLLRSIG